MHKSVDCCVQYYTAAIQIFEDRIGIESFLFDIKSCVPLRSSSSSMVVECCLRSCTVITAVRIDYRGHVVEIKFLFEWQMLAHAITNMQYERTSGSLSGRWRQSFFSKRNHKYCRCHSCLQMHLKKGNGKRDLRVEGQSICAESFASPELVVRTTRAEFMCPGRPIRLLPPTLEAAWSME